MHVYAINYGGIDFEDETCQGIWRDQQKAIEAAIEDVKQIFDDEGYLFGEGFSWEQTTTEDGTPIVVISHDGQETEWWRIEKMEVHE